MLRPVEPLKLKMMKKLSSVLRLFLSCFFLFLGPGCSILSKKPAEHAFPVTIKEVTQRDVPIFIEAIGNVYSLQTVLIRPQVGGIVQEAYIKQGQYVKTGDPLYKIDPRPFQANLDRAKAALIKDTAALQFAQEQVRRYSEVVQKDYVSKLTFNQYQSQVDLNRGQILSDQADIALAQLNLEWSIPVSPINGKISQFNIDPGNLVTANDPNALTDIRQITPADIRFTIPQQQFIQVQKALQQGSLKFEVFLPQEPDKPREGLIYFIDNHINQATGTILLKGTVPNEDEFFWPGEFVQIRLWLRIQPNAILVPEEAIKIGQEGAYVYIYQPASSTAEYRRVTKGEKIGPFIVIEKGVQPGEQVILKGQNNLRPGSKVTVVPSSTPKKESGK